jgi:hypothetical protein
VSTSGKHAEDQVPITGGWWDTRYRYLYDDRDNNYSAWTRWVRHDLPEGMAGNLSYPYVLLSGPRGQREWRHHEDVPMAAAS